MRIVSAVAVTAVTMAVGMVAQMIVRKRVDGPDNSVIGTSSPLNKSLSRIGWRRLRIAGPMSTTAPSMLSVRPTITLERPTRAQLALRVLPIVQNVSAVAVTAAAHMAVGMAAQTIVRKRVDNPDNRVIGLPNLPLS